jgi:hypothetical protein
MEIEIGRKGLKCGDHSIGITNQTANLKAFEGRNEEDLSFLNRPWPGYCQAKIFLLKHHVIGLLP